MVARSLPGFRDLFHRLEEITGQVIRTCPVAGGIEPASVLQFQVLVEPKEVRRALSIISPCNGLVFIVQIGKWKVMFVGQLGHILEAVCRIAFGVIRTDAEKVVIKFDPGLERYVRENIWHPSQTLRKHKDGSLLMTIEVGGLREVMGCVLGFFDCVEAVLKGEGSCDVETAR